MAVTIRLSRQGAKKQPIYLVGAFDSERRRDGIVLERLGQYRPKADKLEDKVKLDRERIDFWLSRGAQMSDTVRQLFNKTSK